MQVSRRTWPWATEEGCGNRKPKDAAVGFKSIVEGSEHFSPVLLGAQEKRSVPKDVICALPLGQGTYILASFRDPWLLASYEEKTMDAKKKKNGDTKK